MSKRIKNKKRKFDAIDFACYVVGGTIGVCVGLGFWMLVL